VCHSACNIDPLSRGIGVPDRYLDQGDQHGQCELRSGIAGPFAPDLDGMVKPEAAGSSHFHPQRSASGSCRGRQGRVAQHQGEARLGDAGASRRGSKRGRPPPQLAQSGVTVSVGHDPIHLRVGR
jgi:hypothetical protein